MVNYRGYLIHFRSEVLSWRFMAAPLLPSFLFFLGECPGNFLQGTRPWQRLGIGFHLLRIRASAPVGALFCCSFGGYARMVAPTKCAKAPGRYVEEHGANREKRAMYYSAPYFITIGRALMAIMFIQSGIEKMFGYAGAQGYMEAHGVPGLLLPLVILTEAGGGLCVLLGLFTRWWAIALAGYCVLAALFFHWHPDDQMQMINFMKNITIAGGFLVLAGAGPGALALDNRR